MALPKLLFTILVASLFSFSHSTFNDVILNIIGLTLHEYRKMLAHLQHLTLLQSYKCVLAKCLLPGCQPLPYYEETLCMSGIDIKM